MDRMLTAQRRFKTGDCPTDGRNVSINVRVLHEACLKLGGEEQLAGYLDIPVHIVHSWLKGRSRPPDDVFLKCLDLLEKRGS